MVTVNLLYSVDTIDLPKSDHENEVIKFFNRVACDYMFYGKSSDLCYLILDWNSNPEEDFFVIYEKYMHWSSIWKFAEVKGQTITFPQSKLNAVLEYPWGGEICVPINIDQLEKVALAISNSNNYTPLRKMYGVYLAMHNWRNMKDGFYGAKFNSVNYSRFNNLFKNCFTNIGTQHISEFISGAANDFSDYKNEIFCGVLMRQLLWTKLSPTNIQFLNAHSDPSNLKMLL